MIFDAVPDRALLLFAHPDDPEVACAGAVTRWTSLGSEVHLVIASRGDKGSTDPTTDPAALTELRAKEADAAAKVMGLASHELWGVPDGELVDDASLRSRIVAAVRRLRPEVVVAPDPTAVFFGNGYVNHPDHRALGWAVLDAVSALAPGPLYEPTAGPAHQVGTMLLAGTLEPDTWIDIELELPRKIAAVRCHASQLGHGLESAGGADVLGGIIADRAADAGRQGGVRYGEGFRRIAFA